MTDQARPEEAARALTEIGHRQEQVIRLAVVPNWYWWAIAVLMVAFAAAVDTGKGLVGGIGTAVFVAGVPTTTGAMVFRAVRRAPSRATTCSAPVAWSRSWASWRSPSACRWRSRSP